MGLARSSGLVLVLVAMSGTAQAAEDVYSHGNFHVDILLEGGFGVFAVDNPNFGVGRVDLRTGENTGDATWVEGYFEPEIRLRFDDVFGGRIYGGLSGIAAITGGDGDAGGFTDGDDEDIDLEKAYGGWTNRPAGDTPVTSWVFDISGGRQNVQLGTGLLIYDGNFDTAGDATYWLAPRSAFSNTAVAKADNGAFDFTGFYIEADKDQDRSELLGVDGNFKSDWGTVGTLYAHIVDSNETIFARDGMDIVDVRAVDLHAPSLPDLTLSAEYVAQFGSGNGNNYDAYAFYVGAAYAASSWPWKPKLLYRYLEFSGADIGDTKIRNFDPLFFGAAAGYGSWFLGEITGEYLLFNSNERAHMVQLTAQPLETLELGAIYYHFELDKKNYFGTPVTSRNFADEVNVYANWTVNDHLFIGALAGLAEPNGAAKQAFGDDKTIAAFEVYAIATF